MSYGHEEMHQAVSEVFSTFGELTEKNDGVQFLSGENQKISGALDREKIHRNDVGEYTANLLMRQRVINEKVVSWQEDLFGTDALVLDGCAGPEGSFLAASRRRTEWIGNEIALKTAKYLKETGATTVISSADCAPFAEGVFDAVLYCFALNNIQNTEGVIAETERILKPGGKILINDPGTTSWLTKLILYSLQKEDGCLEIVKDICQKLPEFSNTIKPYCEEKGAVNHREYTSKVLEGLYGISIENALAILEKTMDFFKATHGTEMTNRSQKYRFVRVFSEILNAQFWAYIIRSATRRKLALAHLGILSTYQKHDSNDWDTTDIFEIDTNDTERIPATIYLIRNNCHELSEQLVHKGQGITKNIISPVLILKKILFPRTISHCQKGT